MHETSLLYRTEDGQCSAEDVVKERRRLVGEWESW